MDGYVDFNRMEEGSSLPVLKYPPITRVQLVRYAGASGDFNPIHTDEGVAHQAGLKSVIAQGPLIMGFAGLAICRWLPVRDLKRIKVRFTGMSYPGDIISIRATVTKKTTGSGGLAVVCDITAQDHQGDMKLSGQFEVFIPQKQGGIS